MDERPNRRDSLVSSAIYIEGGGDFSAADIECRKGFSKLFERMGFKGKMPSCRPYGSRRAAYEAFVIAVEQRKDDFIALLIDSEDPVADLSKPWDHLANRKDDAMPKPVSVNDDQALLMATCMETWFVADRKGLKFHFETPKKCLKESALPSIKDLEQRRREDVHDALVAATASCPNTYRKGARSYKVLSSLDPVILEENLQSFARIKRILSKQLK
jgi:Domain of unknown function (DUF4276)